MFLGMPYCRPGGANCAGDVAGDVPAVTIDVTLDVAFDAVKGAMIQIGNTNSNAADDCNGNQAAESWDEQINGHGGLTVFGTPDVIL